MIERNKYILIPKEIDPELKKQLADYYLLQFNNPSRTQQDISATGHGFYNEIVKFYSE